MSGCYVKGNKKKGLGKGYSSMVLAAAGSRLKLRLHMIRRGPALMGVFFILFLMVIRSDRCSVSSDR